MKQEEVWMRAFESVAGELAKSYGGNSSGADVATKWADKCLDAFQSKFCDPIDPKCDFCDSRGTLNWKTHTVCARCFSDRTNPIATQEYVERTACST